MDVNSLLQRFPLLSTLSPVELHQLVQMSELRTAHKHGFIYLADEPSDYLCFLLQGTIKIGIYSPDGREIIKSIIIPMKLRMPTKPTKASKIKRLEGKAMQSRIKSLRGKIEEQ